MDWNLPSGGIHSEQKIGLTAEEIVSTQPMSLPSGLIFFLDYQYGGNKEKTDDIETNKP